MEILHQGKGTDGKYRIYYLCDAPKMKGYVFQMSRPMHKPDFTFGGWLCSLPAWERTFHKAIVNLLTNRE